ncbi:MAG: hypothetical protein EKK29_08375 [Hyphomicrobiales bacterium]|nr:MAG: hypothetical protein EKK29_08375 [Hyphomicrobiales bacterium]
MDHAFFQVLDNWSRLESRVFAAKADSEADALALQLSSIEDGILRLRPVTKDGALAQLRFIAGQTERADGDGLLSGALRHVLQTLSES